MDPVNPWLDPSEVRRLAEQLLRPVPPAGMSEADPGFDEAFVGFTDPDYGRPKTPAPSVPDPPVACSSTPSVEGTANARFQERFEIFRKWLSSCFNATNVFLLDRDGNVIFDQSSDGRLHSVARNLTLLPSRSGAAGGNVHVKMGPGAVLEVIPCETHYGSNVLGILLPEALPAAHVLTITEILVRTASPA